MGYVFYNCSSIKSLPDISNWNTDKVINMSGIFDNCSSLNFLPEINKWNLSTLNLKIILHKDI